MNILFISTWYPFPPDNGSRIRAYYLAKGLAQKHRVTIVAFRPQHSPEPERPSWACEENVKVYPVAADPFRYTRLPKAARFLSPVPLAAWPQRIMEEHLKRIGQNQKWDAVVAVQLPVSPYALNVPAVPRVLDMDVTSSYQRYLQCRQASSFAGLAHEWLGWQKTTRYERRVCRHFALCSVILKSEADYLRNMLDGTGCEVVVSENGVDLERNQMETGNGKREGLIYTGALTYDANLTAVENFLSQVFPLIKQERPELVFSVTGSTEGVDLRRLPLDSSVRLTGYLTDLRPAVRGSAVCVVPICEGTGTRLKVLEAMALGTPIVSTSKGVEGLNVVHGKHLMVADEPVCFAKYTLQLLADQALGRKLAMNARHLVEEQYDWEQICGRFVSHLEGVTAESRRKDHDRDEKTDRAKLLS